MRHSYVLQAILGSPWAILPAKLSAILAVAERHAAGERLNAEEVQLAIGSAAQPSARQAGTVAVLPLFGTIVPRGATLINSSGMTSTEAFGRKFAQTLADPSVGAVVIDVDSPGGNVQGVDELSAQIYRSRGDKPIVAVANHLAASAAYWISTAADELVVTPSGEVGSIGVLAAHQDMSKAQEQEGITTTLISAGKYKTEGHPYGPLDDEARAAIQASVDEYYGMFVKAVARNRGVKADEVRSGFGEGRVVGAKQALQLGMADRIETLDETVARLQRGMGRKRSVSADAADLDFRRRRARAHQW